MCEFGGVFVVCVCVCVCVYVYVCTYGCAYVRLNNEDLVGLNS